MKKPVVEPFLANVEYIESLYKRKIKLNKDGIVPMVVYIKKY